MTGTRSTVALVVLLSLGTPLLLRSVLDARREVEAVAASNATLELHSVLFASKVRDRRDHAHELDAELAEQRAAVAQSLKLFPSPEIATPERLMEIVQEHAGVTGLEMTWHGCIKPCQRPPPERPFRGVREVVLEIEAPYRGTFDQVIAFLRRLERDPTFVRVNTFKILRNPRLELDDDRLDLVLSLATFRFDERVR